jgi:ferredoxin
VIPVVGFPVDFAMVRASVRQRQKNKLRDRKFKG